MTVSMFSRHKVDDFATWKELYDDAAPARQKLGILADSVHSAPDDPNTIIVYHQFADMHQLNGMNALMQSEEGQSIFKSAGVQLDTIELWVGEDV